MVFEPFFLSRVYLFSSLSVYDIISEFFGCVECLSWTITLLLKDQSIGGLIGGCETISIIKFARKSMSFRRHFDLLCREGLKMLGPFVPIQTHWIAFI